MHQLNLSRTRYLNLSNVIKPTEELDSSPLCQLLFPRHKGSHKPIIAYKRTSNMREVLTKSTYNYPLGCNIENTNNCTDEKL